MNFAIFVVVMCRASEWTLDKPDWTGRLRVVVKANALVIKLEDRNSGAYSLTIQDRLARALSISVF